MGQKKILIVDDEPDVARMLGIRLKSQGYEIVTALDGIQGVTSAHREKPDLIILDVKMPGQDGYTVLENLKISMDTCLIPIMFISALPPQELAEKVVELGAAGFITKPYDAEDVISKVRNLIGE
ncbi:MAG: response regulator [Candidatus Saelkia tenebricola]|nr:response regulator [Candidatus Saelkia tenebricola]